MSNQMVGGCHYKQGGCGQQGGDFLGIGRAFRETFSNPLRAVAAIGTMGASEVAIRGGQAFKKITGVKPSAALDFALAPIALLAPQAGVPTKAVSAGYKAIGLGKKKKAKKVVKKKKQAGGRKVRITRPKVPRM